MHNVIIMGAGKIGSLIACMLATSQDYQVHVADLAFNGTDIQRVLKTLPQVKTVVMDVSNEEAVRAYLQKHDIRAVISSLPYFLNVPVARAARHAGANYFDLTEDTATTEAIREISEGAEVAFVPQCGLAPGFVSIAAHDLIKEFDECRQAKLRVGALPQRANNALHYSLTWSTDGLINEYGNPCYGIEKSKPAVFAPLEGLESIQIDGCEYEAFNTSGGLGSLSELVEGKIQRLNYKTIRYPGHCEKIRFLMHDLRMNDDRETLKRIFEHAIPKTYQDLVVVYISVDGYQQGELVEKSYIKKIHPQSICDLEWSAIQISTASGMCSVVDLVLSQAQILRGFVHQENFSLHEVLKNRFGKYYA